jgi:hypothetical protein
VEGSRQFVPCHCRVREFSPQIVDRRRPRLRHFESLKPCDPDRVSRPCSLCAGGFGFVSGPELESGFPFLAP